MDSHRILIFEECKDKYYKALEEDWARTAQKLNLTNNWGSSGHKILFLKSGFEYIDRLIEDLFISEKTVLPSVTSMPDSYFVDLKSDIEGLILNELAVIRSEAGKINPYLIGYPNDDDFTTSEVQKKEQTTKEFINTKIALLKDEIERRTSQQPQAGTQIHIAGNVGMVNTGQMQINGSLEIRLEELSKTGHVELSNAFSALIEAIKKSDRAERDEQLGNVDFLVSQCKTPKEERNYGLIKTLERVLSNASNISTIWGQVGPEIMKALGV